MHARGQRARHDVPAEGIRRVDEAATTLDGLVYGTLARACAADAARCWSAGARALTCYGCGEDEPPAARGWRKPGAAAQPNARPARARGASVQKPIDLEPLVLKDDDFSRESGATAIRSAATRRRSAPRRPRCSAGGDADDVGRRHAADRHRHRHSQPKAMLVDTAGVGYVVQRGDYVGRPEGDPGDRQRVRWR